MVVLEIMKRYNSVFFSFLTLFSVVAIKVLIPSMRYSHVILPMKVLLEVEWLVCINLLPLVCCLFFIYYMPLLLLKVKSSKLKFHAPLDVKTTDLLIIIRGELYHFGLSPY